MKHAVALAGTVVLAGNSALSANALADQHTPTEPMRPGPQPCSREPVLLNVLEPVGGLDTRQCWLEAVYELKPPTPVL
jgi:hypothetical protein